MVRCVAFSAACLLVSGGAPAQSIAPPPDNPLIVAAPPPLADVVALKTGRVVVIQTLVPLSSRTSKPGERFAIKLASPIVENGRTVVPAGLKREGEVVHAAKAGWGGKPGEMIVNARFLDCGGVRLPIGRMKWSAAGQDKRGDAMVASMIFSPAMFLVSGGNIDIPSGAHGDAKLSADVTIRPGAALGCTVHEGEPQIARLDSGKYFVVSAAPGAHNFSTRGEAKDQLAVEVEAGETYFVRCNIGMGMMSGRANLSPSDEATFAEKAPGLALWSGPKAAEAAGGQ